MSEVDQEALAIIRCMNDSETTDEVLLYFTSFVEQFGVTGVLIGHITSSENVVNGQALRVSTWPAELMRARLNHQAVTHDPIINYALRTSRPFYWHQALEFATRYGHSITEEHRDYGLKDGVMFPIIDLDKTPGGVSIGGEKLTLGEEFLPIVSLVCSHCYYALERMFGPYPFEVRVSLTGMETDALHYAASGKSNWEISKILGLSEPSVKHALLRARGKLNVVNTVQAVAVAMRQKLII